MTTMHLLLLRGSALLGVVLAVACIRDADLGDGLEDLMPEDDLHPMVVARCARFDECGCASAAATTWADAAACEAATQSAVDHYFELAEQHDLVLDEACQQRWNDYYAVPGCDPIDADRYALQRQMEGCALFHGDAAVGEVCSGSSGPTWPSLSNCAAGLRCSAVGIGEGHCYEPVGVDGACGVTGLEVFDCALGLSCTDFLDDDRGSYCVRPAALGESCGETYCDLGGTCDGDVCVTELDVGEPCTRGLDCTWGYCDDFTQSCVQQPAACAPYLLDFFDACDDARIQVSLFVIDNAACEVDEDCVALYAACAGESTCGQIAVNTAHDPTEWAQLEAAMGAACDDCSADPCGFAAACNDGVCGIAM